MEKLIGANGHQRALVVNALVDKARAIREAIEKAEADIAAHGAVAVGAFPETLKRDLIADADECERLADLFEADE